MAELPHIDTTQYEEPDPPDVVDELAVDEPEPYQEHPVNIHAELSNISLELYYLLQSKTLKGTLWEQRMTQLLTKVQKIIMDWEG